MDKPKILAPLGTQETRQKHNTTLQNRYVRHLLLHIVMEISLLASKLPTRSGIMIDMWETGELSSIWKIDNAMSLSMSANAGVL
jgi:hypothetical protein